MDINFHYAAVKVLAHHAGFSKEESQVIAYASQYVDDAVAHEPMPLDRNPDVSGIRFDVADKVFDPICTAHKELDYLRSAWKRKGRLLVYVCFHFIPQLRGTPTGSEFKRVRRDGPLAGKLVRSALKALRTATDETEKTRALIRLGMALHSYADTWAHQKFSGEWDKANNDISNLKIKAAGARWRDVDPVSWFLSYAMPDIGHAEAGTLPDRSEIAWKCSPPKRTPKGQSNCDEFLSAAEKILSLLSRATGDGARWSTVRGKLRKCFKKPADHEDFNRSRKHEWRTQFPGLGFDYDERTWFEDALRPKGGFFDLVGSRLRLDPEDFELRSGREYFYFHAAAKEQRNTVLDAIRTASKP